MSILVIAFLYFSPPFYIRLILAGWFFVSEIVQTTFFHMASEISLTYLTKFMDGWHGEKIIGE